MRRYVRRAALVVPLAAAVLIVPVRTASAETVPSCSLLRHEPRTDHTIEALITNLSPTAGSSVAPGSTISFLVTDEQPFPVPVSRDVVVTVNGTPVTVTAGTQESAAGGPSTGYQVPMSFALPANVAGLARVSATAYDDEGDNQAAACWLFTVQTTALPSGAIGGIGVAALGGLGLIVVQLRRRRGAARPGR